MVKTTGFPPRLDNEKVTEILDSYLSTDKITEEDYSLENAEVYSYPENGRYELQVYSHKTYSETYFWCTIGLTKEEHEKRCLGLVRRDAEKACKEFYDQYYKLSEDVAALTSLMKEIK